MEIATGHHSSSRCRLADECSVKLIHTRPVVYVRHIDLHAHERADVAACREKDFSHVCKGLMDLRVETLRKREVGIGGQRQLTRDENESVCLGCLRIVTPWHRGFMSEDVFYQSALQE